MKLSTRARYALRMMVAIARDGTPEQAVSLGKVAANTMISRRYLEQLAIGLKRSGLIHGVAGRKGGYLLARDPEEITVGEIVEATIGPINIVDCVRRPEGCVKADLCECRAVYERINSGIRDVLHGLTLSELAHVDGSKGMTKVLASVHGLDCPSGDGESDDGSRSRSHH